jgi:hypothetical protein
MSDSRTPFISTQSPISRTRRTSSFLASVLDCIALTSNGAVGLGGGRVDVDGWLLDACAYAREA